MGGERGGGAANKGKKKRTFGFLFKNILTLFYFLIIIFVSKIPKFGGLLLEKENF